MAELINDLAITLEKELTCSICQDIFNQPKTLQCLHSFCQNCITEWNETCRKRRKPLTCPTCISPVELQDGDISNLRSSFHLDSLKQLLRAMRSKASEQDKLDLPNCVSCEKHVTLVAFCLQCEGMVCADCNNAHITVKQLREEHQVTLFGDLKQEHVNSYITNQQRCPEKFHEKYKLEYYCQTCHNCICPKCSITTHSIHDKIGIEDKAEEVKRLIHQNLDKIGQQKQRFLQELEISKKNMRRLENEINTAKKEVSHKVQAHVNTLLDHQNAMTRTLDEMFVQQKAANDEEQTEITAAIQQLDALNNQGKVVQDQKVAFFVLKSQLSQRCKELLKDRTVLNTKPNKRNASVRYIPNPRVTHPLQDLGKIIESVPDPLRCSVELLSSIQSGSITKFQIVTKDSKGELSHTNQGSIDVQIQDDEGVEVDNELSESEPGKYTVTFKAEKCSPYQVVVSIGGEPVKDSPKTLHGKTDFKPVKMFGKKGYGEGLFIDPSSIAVHANTEVFIADSNNDRIVLFNVDGDYIRQFGSQGMGNGELSYPNGVVMYEENILVSDNPGNDGRIQLFNVNGAYLETIYRPQRVILHGICVSDQHIAVCCEHRDDKTQSGIKLLSKQSGHVVQEIPISDQGIVPLFIAYGNGKYFVSSGKQYYIGVYDDIGGFLYKFGDKGKEDGQFNDVLGLAVYGGDMLLVCDGGNHRVQILTQEGQFVTSFGCHGSGVGQMNFPIDVVATRDGKVLVLEFDGKRVQVWQ